MASTPGACARSGTGAARRDRRIDGTEFLDPERDPVAGCEIGIALRAVGHGEVEDAAGADRAATHP